jgi:hypothetical protein
MTNIQPGYYLTIESEDDCGENRYEMSLSGLTEHDVRFYLDLATKIGNINTMQCPKGRVQEKQAVYILKLIQDVLERHPNIRPEVRELYELEEDTDAGAMLDVMADEFLGYGGDDFSEGYNIRQYESHKVFYLPTEMIDVTGEFPE